MWAAEYDVTELVSPSKSRTKCQRCLAAVFIAKDDHVSARQIRRNDCWDVLIGRALIVHQVFNWHDTPAHASGGLAGCEHGWGAREQFTSTEVKDFTSTLNFLREGWGPAHVKGE